MQSMETAQNQFQPNNIIRMDIDIVVTIVKTHKHDKLMYTKTETVFKYV